ncbi:porphobilinogen synthase [Halobacteriovorax marinus]|uniref:Delta-aminolevulinic acid dehydratase n=1 Tax=Halobacteriovorax marinus (strain ATCC BAA-682 / DSM 15412 / SJ) TaxID=862908 RepID=E1X0P5_HALMS|nr:porphobilinogen synthase [Halobacteriovorax marinus]ATH07737.1 porphobilinogen synthase [Halobacteriovorax marinus]CBW26383.1 delta-aminolevulinic acid dehydratase [Halobacteriovorax marinus SJ]
MMTYRPRRNRNSKSIRNLIRENALTSNDLIAPLFVIEGENQSVAIDSMPGQYRLSIDLLVKEVEELWELGVPCVSLFPALDDSKKDKYATESYNDDGLFQRAIRAVKKACPEILVMSDVAMDPYSSDGHDGVVSDDGEILNDETLEILAKMSLSQAKAGSDIIGPSDMMDGRIGYIRDALDEAGFTNTIIMSYTAKYASAFYGPFRDALDSAPKSGDKKTYQMDFANKREAIRETILDEQEGADILMVKPGISYLDIISDMRSNTTLPIAAYNVSGEYAMVKAADEKGWIDGEAVMMEMLTSFKRAGCDMILTYFAKEAATLLRANR